MAALAAQPDPETLAGLYRQMLLIRRFEETVYYLFLEGEIPGTLHQYQGQEAVAVGICDVLRPTDWITSTHRPHGHALAKGVTPRAAMAELFGKSTGCCAGKGGSMHLGDPAVGMLPAIAIVGGGNTVVTGIGLSFALRRSDQVAVCFFGEGASNEGAFHEGMNFAAVRRLPIVFVCENNLYGASTSFAAVSALVDVADRAAAYGVLGRVVDGMDVLAVREAGAVAVASARAGDGPTLLECKTYRFVGHSRSDARGYRTADEEAAWKERDPIPRLQAILVEPTSLGPDAVASLEAEVEATIEDAVEFARASPDADLQEALTDVYA
jgi:TPP-dependent pyruvate/acetoin dehydrogenase alpha subunit